MNIPDLINPGALFACEPSSAAAEINALHRERMAEVIRARDEARDQLAHICSELFDNDDTIGGESAADYVIRQFAKYRAAVQALADQDFGASGWNEQCNQAAIFLRNLLKNHD